MADLALLLARTSRTFALTIPLLPEPTATEVTVAYLLFRIADTFEDAATWSRARRLDALTEFAGLLRDPGVVDPGALAARWVAAAPCTHDGYLALLAETPAVLAALQAIAPGRRAAVVRHTLRTVDGMAGYVARSTESGTLHLTDLPDLQAYCYVVAGIVGELLTDLFVDTVPSLADGPTGTTLRTHARAFGEGLQLVNILKDAADDARDGRVYLPAGVPRAAVLTLARHDLLAAETYVTALQSAHAPRGYVAFTALPVLLARAALDVVEAHGPGAKVTRPAVMAITQALHARLDADEPAMGPTRTTSS